MTDNLTTSTAGIWDRKIYKSSSGNTYNISRYHHRKRIQLLGPRIRNYFLSSGNFPISPQSLLPLKKQLTHSRDRLLKPRYVAAQTTQSMKTITSGVKDRNPAHIYTPPPFIIVYHHNMYVCVYVCKNICMDRSCTIWQPHTSECEGRRITQWFLYSEGEIPDYSRSLCEMLR